MNSPVIVVHYHELWLKGRNRRFFLGKLFTALRRALEGVPVRRIEQPGDRFIVRLGEGASLDEAIARVNRVFGIAFYAVAKPVERNMEALCRAAWEEVKPLQFATFAVRAKRSDKTFPHTSMEIDSAVGRFLLERLRENGRHARVDLSNPDAREAFRHRSRVARACLGRVAGFGADSYVLALEGLLRFLSHA